MIARAIQILGGSLSDVVRTRIIIRNATDCEEVSGAHGWAFKCIGVRPANTLVVSDLIGEQFLIEIEADAELGFNSVLRI